MRSRQTSPSSAISLLVAVAIMVLMVGMAWAAPA